jgi:hypothetical protein
MGRVSAAGRRGPTRPARARAAVACRGAPTRPPQMRPRARQLAAQCAGAAAGQQFGAPRPPPPAAALARRAEAPGEEGGRAARRGGGGGAGGGGPARTATCLLQAAIAPTRPPQMRPRARQLSSQWAGAACALSGPAQQRDSRSDRVLLNLPARDSVVIQDKINAARPAQIVAGVDLVISYPKIRPDGIGLFLCFSTQSFFFSPVLRQKKVKRRKSKPQRN